jgi:hypothetical protein
MNCSPLWKKNVSSRGEPSILDEPESGDQDAGQQAEQQDVASQRPMLVS